MQPSQPTSTLFGRISNDPWTPDPSASEEKQFWSELKDDMVRLRDYEIADPSRGSLIEGLNPDDAHRRNFATIYEIERRLADSMARSGDFISGGGTIAPQTFVQKAWWPLHVKAAEEYRHSISNNTLTSFSHVRDPLMRYRQDVASISMAWYQANREFVDGKIPSYSKHSFNGEERVSSVRATLPWGTNEPTMPIDSSTADKSQDGTILAGLLEQNASACIAAQKGATSVSDMGRIVDKFNKYEEFLLQASSKTDM